MEFSMTVMYKESQCTQCVCNPICDIYKATGGVNECKFFYEKKQTARWIEQDGLCCCSACNWKAVRLYCCEEEGWVPLFAENYCPNCGAKMEVKVEYADD